MTERTLKTAAILISICCTLGACSGEDILIETESFADKGGWVVDHEAFPKIQSACIMAHGIGRPVKDATTTFEAKPGIYDVWVSTYNWTSPWYDGKGPGEFTLSVNGRRKGSGLGTEGDSWQWVKAGKVFLKKNNTVTLHDLTGFNGRADAVMFTRSGDTPDYASVPRDTTTTEYGGYDLVVAGGGIAGCSTALTAARMGLKVALINNVPWLGGNIMYGAHACGKMFVNLYPELGYSVSEMIGFKTESKNDPAFYHVSKNGCSYPNPDADLPAWENVEGNIASTPFIDTWNSLSDAERNSAGEEEIEYVDMEKERIRIAYVREQLLREAGVDIYANKHIYKVEKEGRVIRSVTARDMLGGGDIRISGRLFSDCTGDGDVGYLAGAGFMIGREGKSFAGEKHAPEEADMKMMGSTVYWRAFPREDAGSFPDVKDLPWAAQCDEDYHLAVPKNRWWWETGMEIDNALEPELVRDNYLRCLFGNWAYIKNHVDEYKGMRLDYLNFIAGKRESRRLIGALVLTENDIVRKTEYPDASFTTSWTMDLHYAKEDNAARFPGWEWQTYCTSSDPEFHVHKYDVPYRVLCCRDIDNLFLGGRAISVTHMALGTVRVQCTLGMAGEVTAMAARICKDHDTMPIDVYDRYLDELKAYMTAGTRFSAAGE